LQAVAFLERLGRDEDAEAFEQMSTQEYAEHRGIELANPTTTNNERVVSIMAESGSTKADLQDAIDQACSVLEDAYTPEASREELAEAIGKALDVLQGEDEDEDESGDEDNGDDAED
jgi:hypothetical protein